MIEQGYLTKINAMQLMMLVEVKKECEKTRLIRDKMIERLRVAFGIETQELKLIEKEILAYAPKRK